MTYDVAVIGAGVTGCFIARELMRYNLKVALLERCNDVAMGASKANSGIVHAGFDAKTGTVKAKMNILGSRMMENVCRELSVPFENNGAVVVAFSEKEMETVRELYGRGIANGVTGMKIIDGDTLRAMEPKISEEAVGALLAETSSIVCPYELTIAAAENAVVNGAVLYRNFEVSDISFDGSCFTVSSSDKESICASRVVNAAGCFSDRISSMIGDDSVKIAVRRGEYYILDKTVGQTTKMTVFQCPTEMGKGILVSPTVDHNLLLGPTAMDIENKDDTATTAKGLREAAVYAAKSVPSVSTRFAITSFSGNRSHPLNDDFILGQSEVNACFYQAAGIESPGLTSAPAIGQYIAQMIASDLNAEVNPVFNPIRKPYFHFRHATDAEKEAAIAKNPAYGRIICRCESVTEGEIIDAIHSPVGALDIDGVKRRTRAGMGRCQSGFCGSKVVEILSRELGIPMNEVTKFGGSSAVIYERTK